MTRPDWCPADVWEAATGATALLWTKLSEAQVTAETIARAILAERERCENIAKAELSNISLLLSNPPKSAAAWDIRNAIRAGTPCP